MGRPPASCVSLQEPAVEDAPLLQYAQQLLNDVLVWIGFGTVVGLLAKAIMPGRDPGGALATLLMGVGGTVIGCGTVAFFFTGHRVTPITPLGLIVSTAGAFVILFFYRLLAGRWQGERQQPREEVVVRQPFFSRRSSRATRDVDAF